MTVDRVEQSETRDPRSCEAPDFATLHPGYACYFGSTPEFWIGLQADYDLQAARAAAAASLRRIKPREREAA